MQTKKFVIATVLGGLICSHIGSHAFMGNVGRYPVTTTLGVASLGTFLLLLSGKKVWKISPAATSVASPVLFVALILAYLYEHNKNNPNQNPNNNLDNNKNNNNNNNKPDDNKPNNKPNIDDNFKPNNKPDNNNNIDQKKKQEELKKQEEDSDDDSSDDDEDEIKKQEEPEKKQDLFKKPQEELKKKEEEKQENEQQKKFLDKCLEDILAIEGDLSNGLNPEILKQKLNNIQQHFPNNLNEVVKEILQQSVKRVQERIEEKILLHVKNAENANNNQPVVHSQKYNECLQQLNNIEQQAKNKELANKELEEALDKIDFGNTILAEERNVLKNKKEDIKANYVKCCVICQEKYGNDLISPCPICKTAFYCDACLKSLAEKGGKKYDWEKRGYILICPTCRGQLKDEIQKKYLNNNN